MSDLISRQDAIAIATQEGAYGYISAQELAEMPSAEHGVNADNLIKKIKQLEPLNNSDCPEWVINVIKGEIKGEKTNDGKVD